MKKIMMKVLLISSLALISTPSSAGTAAWIGWYPVKEVYIYSTGSLFISLDPREAHINPADCALDTWLLVDKNQANAKEMYTMVLTAQAAGLRVRAFVDGTECVGNYPKVLHMRSGK